MEQPTRFELVINFKTAKALEPDVPISCLPRRLGDRMTIGEWLLLALRVISRRYSTSVAFGPKRTLSHAYEAGFMSTRPNSKSIRDRVWNWFTDDWGSRFAANAGQLIIMTRWHVDDLLGRFIGKGDVKVIAYPAVAEEDEVYRWKGETLFAELKPLSFLKERKALLTQGSWESLYQQHPIVVGGGMFPIEKLTTVPVLDRSKISKSVRFWDKAASEGGGSYTAGVLMHKMHDKTYVIEHVVRGQWSALDREEKIKFWAKADRAALSGSYEIGVEQEPGSGGKESAESSIRMLAGYKVFAAKVTGSKEARAEPFAAQVQGGNVKLVGGEWQYFFLDELETWPFGKYRDQGDACSGAFNRLALGSTYSLDGF